MFKIGDLQFDGCAALAPMAGVADRAMRELCIGEGAAFCVSELISAKGIYLHDRKSHSLMETFAAERPKGIQLFGGEPEIMAEAVKVALSYSPDFIDINMGCPAPKVASSGGGSKLMRTPDLAEAVIDAAVRASAVPVTVKMRAGWDNSSINAVDIAKRCENAGAAAITVHGRTKAQMYAPPVNLDIIKEVKQNVKIPVIGNGDVTDFKSAAHMYEYTGCDFIMVGRAAMGAPWIFRQINAYLQYERQLPDPPLSQRMVFMLKEIELMMSYKDERVALLEARKHAAWYMRGLRGAAELRRRCASINTFDDVIKIAELALNDDVSEV